MQQNLYPKFSNFIPYIYIHVWARSRENALYMRNENESQPHDLISVTTLVH